MPTSRWRQPVTRWWQPHVATRGPVLGRRPTRPLCRPRSPPIAVPPPSRPVCVLAVLAGQPSWARSQARACGTDGRGGRPAGFPWKGNTESAWDRLLRVAAIYRFSSNPSTASTASRRARHVRATGSVEQSVGVRTLRQPDHDVLNCASIAHERAAPRVACQRIACASVRAATWSTITRSFALVSPACCHAGSSAGSSGCGA